MINYDSFDWGITSENRKFVADVTMEIFQKQNYEKFFEVEKGDTVVDIGASVGPFAYSIMHKKPKEIICLEPQAELFKTLKKNVLSNENTKVTLLKTGISDHDGVQTMDNVYCNGTEYGTRTLVMGITLGSLVNCCDIEKIDFLKVDCEGYEYALFSDDINIDWIFKNVRKIACEFHIFTENQKEKFRDFRDFIIKSFFSKKVRVVSIDGVDITWDLYNEHFIDYYKCFYLFIDNREVKSTVLEITTAMPEKGCPVDCVFCPQGVLTHAPYFGDRILSLENFRKVLNKLPNEVRITFAGFTEPFLNKDTIHMIFAAYDKGHIISIFTTGIGLRESDYDSLQTIPYSSEPNGGFVLHLPDAHGHSNHNITDRYLRLLEKIKNCPPQNFYPVCMGEVHPKIKPIFEKAIVYQMWSRAGNLIKEMQYKPRLINLKDKFGAIYHTEGKMGCNCPEGLNHNVLLPNGNVILCCMDYGLENILGNLFINEYSKILPKENSNFKLCKFCENGVITQH